MNPLNEAPAESESPRRVLVAGGLGFLGLNLLAVLARQGVRARVVTRSLDPVAVSWAHQVMPSDLLEIQQGDIADRRSTAEWVDGVDLVVNLAGESGASRSVIHAREDMASNVAGHLNLLDGLRESGAHTKIVFVSSRLVYGVTGNEPVSEESPTRPTSLYGVHKLTVEHYHRLYSLHHGIPSCILRVTNPYGPYQLPQREHYGVINRFVMRAVAGEAISLYGGGAQLRDYLHAEDVAAAILRVAATPACVDQILNLGFGRSSSMREVAETIVRLTGRGRVEEVDWPSADHRVETGDFVCDTTKLARLANWHPQVQLEDGLRSTIEFYRRHLGGPSAA